MTSLLPAALTAALFTLPAAHAADSVPSVAERPDLADLAPRWHQAAADLGVPGYAIAVVKDGRLYALDCYGFGDEARQRPVNGDTMFYIASITKTYTAFGLSMLADDGAVDLDGPVLTYLPRFRLADPAVTETVTIRDLLCHKPGINQGPIVRLDAYTGQITEDRFYHWLAQAQPRNEVRYTNVHFTIAGRVIEAVTGEKWQDFLRDSLFEPAGMSRTTAYASIMYGDPNCAFPMIETAEGFIEAEQRKTDRVMHAAGGMGTTAVDGARWIELFLNGGEVDGYPLVGPGAVEESLEYQSRMAQPDGQIRKMIGYGLGWFRGEYRGRPYAQHGGGYVGTAAHISFLPEQRIGMVVLTNGAPGGNALGTVASIDVYDRLLGEPDRGDLLPSYVKRCREARDRDIQRRKEDMAGDPVTADVLEMDLAAYGGTYANEHWGALHLWVEDDTLRARNGDMIVRLFAGDSPREVQAAPAAGDRTPLTFRVEDGKVTGLSFDEVEYRKEATAP